MKIGLYFGSFNPVHIGHCIIASHVCQAHSLDQVWLVVSPQNPFKASKTLLNEYHRLHLVNLALEGSKKLKSSDIEFHLPRPSYTVDTLAYLSEKYPQHQFVIIMGSDSFENLGKWKNAPVLIRQYSFLVFERPGHPFANPLNVRAEQVKAPLLEISSTHIRQWISEGKSIQYLVPDAVREEIESNGYYRNEAFKM
jgi:nicotinate-nucleotide adenylyltransferase